MQKIFSDDQNISIIEDEVLDMIVENGSVKGVVLANTEIYAKAIILTTGTFLNGTIHIGEKKNTRRPVGGKLIH